MGDFYDVRITSNRLDDFVCRMKRNAAPGVGDPRYLRHYGFHAALFRRAGSSAGFGRPLPGDYRQSRLRGRIADGIVADGSVTSAGV